MNRFFKTLWSTVHQQYVVTNEKQASHGKPAKALSVAVVGASLLLGAAAANAAYEEQGVLGDSVSWESAEYQKDWGLKAMNSSAAYALGFNGSGIQTGMMDTGALSTHPEFDPKRFSYVKYRNGQYSSTGNRYPVPGYDTFGNGAYEIGQNFLDSLSNKGQAGEIKELTGAWILHVNDSHGTHVVGTIGANRDGNEMHGVAWGADVTVGNNGGLDNSNYGPFQDYAFYKSIYEDTVAGRGANGKTPMFINSSWGTNVRLLVPGVNKATGELDKSKQGDYSVPVNTVKETEYEYFLFNAHARQNWEKAAEFNKNHANKVTIPENKLANFVDGLYDAVKDKNVVHMITTGNRPFAQPYYRANYPYFNPNAEHHWVAVGGIQKNEDGSYSNIASFNAPGEAKWWSVVAPGDDIYSTVVCEDTYVMPDEKHELGKGYYDSWGGTSMANPHVTGAMTVLASRYKDMDAFQVRNTMLTTAHHKNVDGTTVEGWTAAEGTPDVVYGWGIPDLNKGMFGPGQFLGKLDDHGKFDPNFNYVLHGTDVWTNDVTQVAHDARLAEEKAWIDNDYANWKQAIGLEAGKALTAEQAKALAANPEKFAGEFKLDGKFDVTFKKWVKPNGQWEKREFEAKDAEIIGGYKDVALTAEEKAAWEAAHPGKTAPATKTVAVLDELRNIDLADAILWRDMAFEKRYAGMMERAKHAKLGLIKDGEGTLALLGKAEFKGDTLVKNGALYAFGKTFGSDSGKIVVEGGAFGITPVYVDQLTLQGRLTDNTASLASIDVKKGGTLDVLVSKAALEGNVEDTKIGSLSLEEGSTLRLASLDWAGDVPAAEALKGKVADEFRAADGRIDLMKAVAEAKAADFSVSGTITTDEAIKGDLSKVNNVDYIALKQTSELNDAKTTLTVKLAKKSAEEQAKTVAGMNLSANEAEVVKALAEPMNFLYRDLRDVKNDAAALANDSLANAQTASLMNKVAITNAILDRAAGFGADNDVQQGDLTLWGNALGNWGKVELGVADTTADYVSGLIGGEMAVSADTKVGALVGYSHGDLDADALGKVKTQEFHAGLYANTKMDELKLSGGALYTHEKHDLKRDMQGFHQTKFNTNHVELFGEVTYAGLNAGNVTVEPYAGLNWMHFAGKSFVEGEVTTKLDDQNVYAASIGVRASTPVSVGSVALNVKGDVGYKHFFGDKPAYDISVGTHTAKLEGDKLKGLGTVSLGVDAKLTKAVTAGVSYEGAFGSDVHSNGVKVNVTYRF